MYVCEHFYVYTNYVYECACAFVSVCVCVCIGVCEQCVCDECSFVPRYIHSAAVLEIHKVPTARGVWWAFIRIAPQPCQTQTCASVSQQILDSVLCVCVSLCVCVCVCVL